MAEINEKDFPKPDPKKPAYFPDMFCDPEEKKTESYARGVAKATYFTNWATFNNAYGNTQRGRLIDNRAWSNGVFDVTSFMGGKSAKNAQGSNPLMKQIDFDPVTELPKIRDIVVGYMEELDFDITATSINPAAAAEKENYRLNELFALRQRMNGFAQKMNQTAGMPIMPESTMPFPVTDEQELNMYFQLGGMKQIAELEIELGNQIVQNDSDWRLIKKQLLEDSFDYGALAVDIEYCRDGRLRYKRVDPVNMGYENFNGHFNGRPGRIWYIELKTVYEVLTESNGQFTPAQMRDIAQLFENRFGNPAWNAAYQGYQTYVNTDAPNAYFYYNWQIPVMKLYWSELDSYKLGTPGEQPNEQVNLPKDQHNNRSKTPDELRVHRYYQTKWIVNSDYVYDYGRVPFQSRDPYNASYSLCPLKHYRIAMQPLCERIKPWVKKIFMACQKMDNELARKKPSGYQINVKALENISLGQGKTFTVKHAIEMWNEQGDLLIADEAVGDMFGQTKHKTAVVPISQVGFYEAMQGYMQYINFCLNRISQLTGINEFTDGTNPNANTPAAVAQMAAQGTKNSLSQIASAIQIMTERCAIDVSDRLRLVIQANGPYSGYGDALGNGMMQSISVTDHVLAHRFGIRVTARPTAQDRAEMKQAVFQAFSNMATPDQGGLWVTDAMRFEEMINAGVNLKLIRLMLAATIKQKLNMLQQERMEMIQAQTESLNDNKLNADQSELRKYAAMKEIDLMYERNMAPLRMMEKGAEINTKAQNNMLSQTHKANLKTRNDLLDARLGEGAK